MNTRFLSAALPARALLCGLFSATVVASAAAQGFGADVQPVDDPLIPYSAVVIDESAELPAPDTDELAEATQDAGLVDVQADSIRPLPAIPRSSLLSRPIRVSRALAPDPGSTLKLIGGESVQVHADGMPGPNAPSSDPFVRVLPRAVNPADVKVGARWTTQDRIDAPLLSNIQWGAHADLLAGAAPPGAGNVRRSLRLTVKWDQPEDLTIGLTPAYERGGGTIFEHYVTGLQATTLDPKDQRRWSSFVEVSGEKIAPGNVIDNPTARANFGLSYSASSTTQFDLSVSRSTMTTSDDLSSSLGLSVHF